MAPINKQIDKERKNDDDDDDKIILFTNQH
jgi:hypothetical protein